MIYKLVTTFSRRQKGFVFLGLDVINAVLAFLISWALVAGGMPSFDQMLSAWMFLIALPIAAFAMSRTIGLHRIKLIAFEFQGMLETGSISIFLGLLGAGLNLAWGPGFPVQVFIIMAMTSAILSVGTRLILRHYLTWLYGKHRPRKRILVYGAGQTGQQLAAALKTDHAFEPVGFVDDNPNLHLHTIGGLKVYPPVLIRELVAEKQVDRVVIAMPSASTGIRAGISRRLNGIGCEVQTVPSFAELVVEGKVSNKSVPVIVNELLGRPAFEDNLPGVNGAYHKRRVLVTGAGGSIGTELCRQLLLTKPDMLIMLDHSELALYEIDRELTGLESGIEIVPVLGSVTDRALMERVMRDQKIDVVLHAAAYKHLPMVQTNAASGLRNNVFGTRITAEAAYKAGVERFILVSTDKAVRPTSIMGASKRLAELVVQDMATRPGKTRFAMVRFGNVLGSSGSVLPLFTEQINAGGPVTVTHRRVTRFFMTVSEAVSLVLLAGTFARGGEVFVLNMGEPVRIINLARQMIVHAGYTVRDAKNPTGDIEIAEIGLRDGEKLQEELLIGTDMLTTPHKKILRAQEKSLSKDEMAELLKDLHQAISTADDTLVQTIVSKWVEHEDKDVTVLHPQNPKAKQRKKDAPKGGTLQG